MGPKGFPYLYGIELGRRLQPVPWALRVFLGFVKSGLGPVPWALRVFLGTVASSYGRP